jgi:hypothetical protein
MDISEHLVLMYLTKDGHVFVCRQYSIRTLAEAPSGATQISSLSTIIAGQF